MDHFEENLAPFNQLSGKLLRKIRESKGYTQKHVSQGIMRQSTYSKIEREETEPSAPKLFAILDRLEISVEEFLFIQGDYRHSKKGNIIYEFVSQKYNVPEELEKLKSEVTDYLHYNEDPIVQDIQSIYEGLIIFGKTHDIRLARKHVQPVWDRLESFDEWHLTEIYLVNNILYFFNADSAIHISDRAITQLERYEGFRASNSLRFNFQFNLVYLLIDNGQFDKALVALESLILYAKQLKKHDMLAVCYARKGVSMLKSGNTDGNLWIKRGTNMLKVIEEDTLKKHLEEEVRAFLKHPSLR
ncbi:helix-turn-helix domain-containing protein [Marinilactibacillus kalidii]|uniref:helix-turn-helix domain-containing protein n=1 Tax=Marinilactibacillus kalidii TaxID=2820274 RepID=UPI001ABE318D|nr:Rgg/GadR/MutR family transcriptional regulator [Marinilactibacillus kalidii]